MSSYAISAVDEIGTTGSASDALGVADYFFINDSGLGFGGTNTDSFDVGESTVFEFPVPLLNLPTQHDLVISAFVEGTGTGGMDNATIRVEVSSDGSNFTIIDTFDTEEARSFSRNETDRHERAFDAVKHFWVEFGAEDAVTHVRLTNLAGTAEGFRLDSIEGLHPDTASAHAFEVRFERYRVDASERFLLRIKNTSNDLSGVPIRGFFLEKLPVAEWMEDTTWSLFASDGVGEMLCVDNCVDDADAIPGVHSTTWVFSLDGLVPAPAGVGLDPGLQVSQRFIPGPPASFQNIDIDALGSYLSGFTFRVDFADGESVSFDFDNDVMGFGNIGALYQKYTFYSSTPSLSGPRPVHHFEYVEMIQVPGLGFEGAVLMIALLLWAGVAALGYTSRSTSV